MFNTEQFPYIREIGNYRIMRTVLDIKIAGIKPPANSQTGYSFKRFIFCFGCRSHSVAVKMLFIYRRLKCIVLVRMAVPNTVSLVDKHMIHLNGKINIKSFLPNVVVNMSIYGKGFGLLIAVFYKIQTAVLYLRKIECNIIVSSESSPIFNIRR